MTFTSLTGPQNKFDHQSLTYLDTLPVDSWKHLIWDLFSWLSDRNWPIYLATADLLLKNPHELLDSLRRIYRGDDDELQCNCLVHVIPRMPEECRAALALDLRRFREGVSDEVDADWDMRELVDEVLEGYS